MDECVMLLSSSAEMGCLSFFFKSCKFASGYFNDDENVLKNQFKKVPTVSHTCIVY